MATRKSQPKKARKAPGLVGRAVEQAEIRACIAAGRNVLLEGPVGVGKTHLALAVCEALGRPVYRVDGDGRYSEQKLSGWFDPPLAIRHGYSAKSFVPGPLVEAMRSGGVLFINELNRLPEGVQNILLPAIDERKVVVPRLGTVEASPGFCVIATQNPKEFVATSHLSEALLDRFELVALGYQSAEEEQAIVARTVRSEVLVRASVALARMTRNHPRIRRGASVRAAQAVAEIAEGLMELGDRSLPESFVAAAILALPTRIEIERDPESTSAQGEDLRALIREWASEALSASPVGASKKKS